MKHEVAAPMIGDLLHGRLQGETRNEVLTHVTSCEECRSLSETYGLLSEALCDHGGEHPSADEIVKYAFAEDQLTTEERDRIAEHVLGCDLCASELETTNQAEAELVADSSPAQDEIATSFDRRSMLAAAVAAAVVLVVLAYPAYLGLFEVPRIDNRLAVLEAERLGREASVWSGPLDLNIFQAPLREAGDEIVAVHLAQDQPQALLAVDPGLLEEYAGAGTVFVDLRDASGRSTWSWELTENQVMNTANGLVTLLVPAEVLASGDWTMSVSRGAGRAEPVFDAPFRVTRSDGR
jgi:hypothetical protein